MNYNLVYADERTKFFIARYKTRGEAEAARENLAYNTNEFSFEKMKIIKENKGGRKDEKGKTGT